MLQKSDFPRPGRSRKKEELLNILGKVVGCLSVVIMVATMFYVVVERLLKTTPNTDPDTLEAMYGTDTKSEWSGETKERPALFQNPGKSSVNTAPEPSRIALDKLAESKREAAETSAAVPVAKPFLAGITNIEAKRPQIEAAVRGFFDAQTVEEKLTFCRDPQRVRPFMQDYTRREKPSPHTWQSLGFTLPVDEPGFRLGYVQANFSDAPPMSLVIEEMENGSFRVDWESSVRYGELAWDDFLRTKPAQPTLFRVIASKVESTLVPQSAGMPKGECIEIKHPSSNGVVYAPLNKDDPQIAPLLQQLQTGQWKDVPVTLRLCYPGEAKGGIAVRIAGVEGKGWLILHPNRS